MPGVPLGKDAVLYLGTLPVAAAAVADVSALAVTLANWVEYDNVIDLSANFDAESVDATTRATAKLGWSAEIFTANKSEVTFGMLWLKGNAGFERMKNAFLRKTLLPFWVANGLASAASDAEPVEGLSGNFSVSMKLSQPVKGIQTWDVTLKLADYPNWLKKGTGTLALAN